MKGEKEMKVLIAIIVGILSTISFLFSCFLEVTGNTLHAIYYAIVSFYLYYQTDSMMKDIKND